MGGSKGESSSSVRFAPYIEMRHTNFLQYVVNRRNEVYPNSPFDSYSDIEIGDAFFGSGYVLSSFPSLYDMFGKFMAGLDIEVLFDQVFEDTVDSVTVNNLISEEGIRLEDDIIENAHPRFSTGMRDINAVMSSTFVVGKAMMETTRTKEMARFGAELRYRLIPVATERWRGHLEWNKAVVMTYAEILKLYITAKMDVDNHNLEIAAKDLLWPFTIGEYERVALGALTGARDETTEVAGSSRAGKAIGGALTGAAGGFMVGGPVGAAVGGAVGLAGGLLS